MSMEKFYCSILTTDMEIHIQQWVDNNNSDDCFKAFDKDG